VRGIRKKLVNMAEENAEEVLKSRSAAEVPDVTDEIAKLLGLEKAPESIGAFDISNIAGTSAVGAFVWWENGGFNKARYRHVRMDAVKGPDDYAMMKEMVRRTIQSMEADGRGKTALPDLVIIDGGREHLKAAQEVLVTLSPPLTGGEEKGGEGSRPAAAGLAKDPDRIFLEGRDEPISLDDNRAASLLLKKIRDEVHRFAVTYHRKLRARKAFDSALDSIYGLGRKRRFALLERFGSIEAVKRASAEEISSLKGFNEKLAHEVLASLNKAKGGKEQTA
jgi:excinuclease ABC subunit C